MIDEKKTQESKIKFRTEAVEYFSQPHSAMDLIQITKLWSWVVIAPLAILVISAIIWSFIGSIATWVEGNGIILPVQDSLYSAIALEGGTQITEFTIKPKDAVSKGQVLAYMDAPLLKENFFESEQFLHNLQKTYNDLKQDSKKEIQSHKISMEKQKNLSEGALINQQKHLNFLQNNLEKLSSYSAQKIVINSRIEDLKERVQSTVEDIERLKIQLIQNEVEHMNFVDKWHQRLRDLEIQIQNTSHERDQAYKRLEASNKVISPIDGVVVGIQKTIGDYVSKGDIIVTILDHGTNLNGIFYINAEHGKKIENGMKVLITPAHIKKEEFGSIEGYVSSISEFPVNRDRMLSVLKNQELIENIAPDGSPFELQVILIKDSNTQSGFKWTSSKGGDHTISSGMPVAARIIVKEQSPISLIIPAFKKLLGE